MPNDTLIPLPAYDTVARASVELLLQGKNVAVIGPPGAGTTSVGAKIQQELVALTIPYAIFDCSANGDLGQRLADFRGPDREQGKKAVILIDNGNSLSQDKLQSVVARLREIALQSPTAMSWLGAFDTHSLRTVTGDEIHVEARAHLCLPQLGRDDLLRLYQVIATRGDRYGGQWGEAMMYFVLDWCGNDLALVEELVEHFCNDWTENIYDESVAECLGNWLNESPAVATYRNRFDALSGPCKQQLALLCAGGKLISHRPEIHLETSDQIRHLFLNGFLCNNLLPGYYQFRSLLARYVVEEKAKTAPVPIELLRRSANGRVNALLQDVEVALRAMLRIVFRQKSAGEVQALLEKVKTEQKLYEPALQRTLLDWADKIPVSTPYDTKAELGRLLKEERDKFEASTNLWTRVCDLFAAGNGLASGTTPSPEQVVDFLTFSELAAMLQSLTEQIFEERPKSKRLGDPPKKRWPDYLTKVRRLRNEAAHLRNISFQDIEDLLDILKAIRRDQLDFLIVS